MAEATLVEKQPATRVMSMKREQRPEMKKLQPGRLQQAEFAHARMSAELPFGWTIDDALKPEFWSNCAFKFQTQSTTGRRDYAGSIIEVRTVDHAFYAQLYVRAVESAALLVDLISIEYFGPKNLKLPDGFEMRWNDSNRTLEIIRTVDREIVAFGLKTREAAQIWVDKTLKAN